MNVRSQALRRAVVGLFVAVGAVATVIAQKNADDDSAWRDNQPSSDKRQTIRKKPPADDSSPKQDDRSRSKSSGEPVDTSKSPRRTIADSSAAFEPSMSFSGSAFGEAVTPRGSTKTDRVAKRNNEGSFESGAKSGAPNVGAAVPARYRIVASRNLFRKLGWAPPAAQNPFTLIGVVDDGKRRRALLVRQGSEMGVYATVGEAVGQGYRIAAIEPFSVRLAGGALGTVTCEMNREIVGVSGGGDGPAPSQPVPTKMPSAPVSQKKYYPARGARFENVVREILEREGISWQQVERDKNLQQKLKSKYQYLEDEGYVTFPKD